MVQVRRCAGSSGAVSPRLCPRVSWLWKEAPHHASWLMLEAGAVKLKPEIRHRDRAGRRHFTESFITCRIEEGINGSFPKAS